MKTETKQNLLLGFAALAFCGGLIWIAWEIMGQRPSDLPGYPAMVEYDPSRIGGHLKPNLDIEVIGERRGQGVRVITNGQGFRAAQDFALDPAPGTLRILLYGDSMIDGMRTGQDDTTGAQLERLLNAQDLPAGFERAEVIISGHNNPANAWYHYQQHGRRFQPHWVLLAITLGNDLFHQNLGHGLLLDLQSPRRMLTLVDDEFPGGRATPHWLPAQAIATDAASRTRSPLASGVETPALGRPFSRPGRVSAIDFFASLGQFVLPMPDYAQAAFERLGIVLQGMQIMAAAEGAEFAAIALPARPAVDPDEWQALVEEWSLNARAFDRDQPSRWLADYATDNSIRLIDPLPALRDGAQEQMMFRPEGDMHFNVAGQTVIAEVIANALQAAPAPQAVDFSGFAASAPQTLQQAFATDRKWLAHNWPDALDAERAEDRELLNLMLGVQFVQEGPMWTIGKRILFELPAPPQGACWQYTLNLWPFLGNGAVPEQRVAIEHRGQILVEDSLTEPNVKPINFTWDTIQRQPTGDILFLKMNLPDATAPSSVSDSPDTRDLAVVVNGLTTKNCNHI